VVAREELENILASGREEAFIFHVLIGLVATNREVFFWQCFSDLSPVLPTPCTSPALKALSENLERIL
jgi:hypothetical protein